MNVRQHSAFVVQQFVVKNNISVVPHPSHLANLSAYDLFLFLKLKTKSKRQRFEMIEEVQVKSQAVLNTFTKNNFQDIFIAEELGLMFESDGGE